MQLSELETDFLKAVYEKNKSLIEPALVIEIETKLGINRTQGAPIVEKLRRLGYLILGGSGSLSATKKAKEHFDNNRQ